MYLYTVTIVAKPNLFSSDFEIRQIDAELYHPEQIPFNRAKQWILAELNNDPLGLTAIVAVSYSLRYRPELAINSKENNNVQI